MTVAHAQAELAKTQANDVRLMEQIAKLEESLSILRTERAENKEKATRLQDYIRLDQELSNKYGQSKEVMDVLIHKPAPKVKSTHAGAKISNLQQLKRVRTTIVTDAAERILKEHHRSIQTKELVYLLKARDVHINSAHENNYISNILSKSEKFFTTPGEGWRLRGDYLSSENTEDQKESD